jgi:thiamine-monophosphate kinase
LVARGILGLTMKKPLGELALIQRIRSGWGGTSGGPARHLVLGIGDDCAILRPPRGHEVLVTTDLSLEGRHFRRDWHPPESIGHRALARGLSDLAAMGARPLAAFLSLALPAELLSTRQGRAWIQRFFTGLRTLAAQFATPLAGGDTSESPANLILADIVLVGSAPAGRALRRSTAHPGDLLYVTGALGGSAAELEALGTAGEKRQPTLSAKAGKDGPPASPHPHFYPQPRIAVGQALLRRRLATAAIDLSDGLSIDLAHLCRESSGQQSKLGAQIEAAALPIHPLAAQSAHPLDLALHGGEDYELLFAASPAAKMPRSIAGVPITRIGRLTSGPAITLVDAGSRQRPLKPSGWEHFTKKH